MHKNILSWSHKKIAIDTREQPVIRYKEREVWWVEIGHNVGSEQNGSVTTYSRPVVIVKGFSATLSWGVPLSTTSRRGLYDKTITIKGEESVALLSQLRAFDTRRLGDKLGVVDENDMNSLRRALIRLLES